MIKMIEYLPGEWVPEEQCTIDRYGGADDWNPRGTCEPEGDDCKNCVVNKIF
jgi:hypothetical protein